MGCELAKGVLGVAVCLLGEEKSAPLLEGVQEGGPMAGAAVSWHIVRVTD